MESPDITNRSFPNLKSGKGNVLLFGSVVIFLIIKLYLLSANNHIQNFPRTGNDSIIYLLKGVQLNFEWSNQKPIAISDINAQTKISGVDLPQSTLDSKKRLYIQTRVGLSPISYLMLSLLAKSELSITDQFFIFEIVILVIFIVSMACFLVELFDQRSAAVGLLFLSVMTFPERIYDIYFTPSLLAQSFTLFLWAAILHWGKKIHPFAVFSISLLAILSHDIGLIYVISSFAVYLISIRTEYAKSGIKRFVFSKANLVFVSSIIFAIGIKLLMFTSQVKHDLNISSLFDGLQFNTPYAMKSVWSMTVSNLGVVLFAVWAIWQSLTKNLNRTAILTLIFCIPLLILALFHYLPPYAAELFKRNLMFALIIIAGFSGSAIYRQATSGTRFDRNLYRFGTMAIFFVYFFVSYKSCLYLPTTSDDTFSLIDDESLLQQYDRIDKSIPVIYAENDIALLLSLVKNQLDRRLISYPLLKGTPELSQKISEIKPGFIVVPNYLLFMGASKNLVSDGHSRELGIYFPAMSQIIVTNPNGPISNLTLHIKNLSDQAKLNIYTGSQWQTLDIAKGFEGWLKLPLNDNETSKVSFRSSDMLWLKGLSISDKQETAWPWDSSFSLEAIRKDDAYMNDIEKYFKFNVNFSVSALLQENGVNINDLPIDQETKVFHDQSGLLFIKTKYWPGE